MKSVPELLVEPMGLSFTHLRLRVVAVLTPGAVLSPSTVLSPGATGAAQCRSRARCCHRAQPEPRSAEAEHGVVTGRNRSRAVPKPSTVLSPGATGAAQCRSRARCCHRAQPEPRSAEAEHGVVTGRNRSRAVPKPSTVLSPGATGAAQAVPQCCRRAVSARRFGSVSVRWMFDLSDKTALVTGAGQNVGAGIAAALATQGAHVLVNDLVAQRAAEVADQLTAAGGSAASAAFDVTDLDAIQAELAEHPPINILVNNAGNGGAEQMRPKPFSEMDPTEWDSPIEVNLRGVLNCVHAVINPMVEAGWGRIITISSGAGAVWRGYRRGTLLGGQGRWAWVHAVIGIGERQARDHCKQRGYRLDGPTRGRGALHGASGPRYPGEALGLPCRYRRYLCLPCQRRGQLDDRPDNQPQWRFRHQLSGKTGG